MQKSTNQADKHPQSPIKWEESKYQTHYITALKVKSFTKIGYIVGSK